MHWSFMAMKRFVLIAMVAAGSLAGPANAQLVNGKWQPPKSSGSRQGVIVTPTPAAAPVLPANPSLLPALFGNPSYPIRPVPPVQPVAFTLVPAIIMSDGSILADFGFGYEPVVRSCAGGSTVVVQPVRRIGANGRVLPQSGPVQVTTLSAAAQTACFTRDGLGRVFVYRRS